MTADTAVWLTVIALTAVVGLHCWMVRSLNEAVERHEGDLIEMDRRVGAVEDEMEDAALREDH